MSHSYCHLSMSKRQPHPCWNSTFALRQSKKSFFKNEFTFSIPLLLFSSLCAYKLWLVPWLWTRMSWLPFMGTQAWYWITQREREFWFPRWVCPPWPLAVTSPPSQWVARRHSMAGGRKLRWCNQGPRVERWDNDSALLAVSSPVLSFSFSLWHW